MKREATLQYVRDRVNRLRQNAKATRPQLKEDMDNFDHLAIAWHSGLASALMLVMELLDSLDEEYEADTEADGYVAPDGDAVGRPS